MSRLQRALDELAKGGSMTLARVPDGYDAFLTAQLTLARAVKSEGQAAVFLHIATDGQRSGAFREALAFAAPQIEALEFPAWDCQPYDRVSPNADISSRRMTTLARLARTGSSAERPRIVCTTVSALVQRVAPRVKVASESFSAAAGDSLEVKRLVDWLEVNGFQRSSTVNDVGDYAVRGGIIDLYAASMSKPLRLDFFGDTLETIRTFDPSTQRSLEQLADLDLVPMSEVQLTSESIRRFRQNYVAQFGGQTRGDLFYEAVSEGRRHPGMEHWMPLFWPELDSLFDYLPSVPVLIDAQVEGAVKERFETILDHYQARQVAHDKDQQKSPSYKPLPPDQLYVSPEEWQARLDKRSRVDFTPFALESQSGKVVIDCHGSLGRNFASERSDLNANIFEVAVTYIREQEAENKKIIIAGWSDGSRERLSHVLSDHGLKNSEYVSSFAQAKALKNKVALAVLPIEHGFADPEWVFLGEQDILGDRLVRSKKRRPSPNYLSEIASISAGDLVVHVDHGIGRFVGLKSIEAVGAPHDCLELHYYGGDKLFLPVENLELLSRYGAGDTNAELDRLGGAGWQNRKARMRKRILEMAHGLIALAAARSLKEAPKLLPLESAYEEFCARFPYDETDDQLGAITQTLEDLAAGKPMDRLICGDVGFGKTEVALRAAFTAAINGKQVAVVVPTTLLARQHYRTFCERFSGLPIRIAQVSRIISSGETKAAKAGLADGTLDIVIGTHALLGKSIQFRDLGLVIVDEEQHFGVGHKERLKNLRQEVHVLTLSATPIPRTLQLALTGVRDLSIIATPPVDRLAVRTFVMPFDELSVREALLRERYRGGQSFFVCPRIEDLEEASAFLRQSVPEVSYTIAHGQIAARELEEKMTAFYEGHYDVLLATAIVESGLDIPRANTLIVFNADRFGLAQLYQLRGRVGRSKTRAYALFTTSPKKVLTPHSQKRLTVLQSLDTLGAGFQLATHDLDLRGAGNLLGDEQSGHVKEVGYELYQQMLQDAVAALKAGIEEPQEEAWAPTITTGTAVTIPEIYVEDLSLRLNLYKRLSSLHNDQEIEAIAVEMIDRFGPMPVEVEQLLQLVAIKILCRQANIEKLDAGPRGLTIAFRDNAFANPQGLVRFINEQGPTARVRPDRRIVIMRDFHDAKTRLQGTRTLMRILATIASSKGK